MKGPTAQNSAPLGLWSQIGSRAARPKSAADGDRSSNGSRRCLALALAGSLAGASAESSSGQESGENDGELLHRRPLFQRDFIQ